MSPLSQSDGFDAGGLIDKLVPGVAALIDDFGVGLEDAVGEPVAAHELPDILDRIELRAFGRQRHDADIIRQDEFVGDVPAGLIHEQDGMGPGRNGLGDFSEMQVHGIGVAERQDEPCTLAVRGADRAEDIGRGGPLVMRRRRTRSTAGPTARDLVLLPYPCLVLEPYLYGGPFREARADLFQLGGKAPFLKASSASVS